MVIMLWHLWLRLLCGPIQMGQVDALVADKYNVAVMQLII